jgi:hypothetical protein
MYRLALAACILSCCAAAESAATESSSADSTPPVSAIDKISADDATPSDSGSRDADTVAPLLEKPLYKFTEAEVDVYLRYLHAEEPDLRRRIIHLARKNIGQPYELYLLGEMPFEPYDPQPLYCLAKSDCVVFSEHTYAMALGRDWPSFMAMLQRLRYRDGRIGVATRNHYTEADWNINNRWLVHDITAEIAGDTGVEFEQKIDRAQFLKSRYGLDVDIPVEKHKDVYVPFNELTRARLELRDGDFVNVVRGTANRNDENAETFGGTAFVGHVGLVAIGADGTVNFLHSSEPEVREEPLVDYIARQNADRDTRLNEGKPVLLGFKFLRLEENPLTNLQKIDGKDAPRVTLPRGGAAKF